MKEFFKSLADYIFGFPGYMILVAGTFIWIASTSTESQNRYQEQTRRLTEACYSQGLVLVNTDAGQRCADPRSLVKVK